MGLKVGIVGASGAVGKELIRLLGVRKMPVDQLKCFGSSKGRFLPFQGEKIPIETLSSSSFEGLDVVFFSAGSAVSKEYVNLARKKNVLVIDNSSAFRQDPKIPLVIPEVNPEDLENHDLLIANPNCAVIILLTALFPLHSIGKLKRIVLSTYQAASGAGLRAMEELKGETLAYLNEKPFERTVMQHPYAFNLFLHNSGLEKDGYFGEEVKIIEETRKILKDKDLKMAVTCVRVPTLRAHAESINAEFHNPVSVHQAYEALRVAKGVQICEDFEKNRFAMPIDAAGQEDIFCSRIRKDLSQENTLDLWVVGDQLLKGAALNAIQILECLRKKEKVLSPTLPNF